MTDPQNPESEPPEFLFPLDMKFLSGSDILRKNQSKKAVEMLDEMSDCESVEEEEISQEELAEIKARGKRDKEEEKTKQTQLKKEAQKFHI